MANSWFAKTPVRASSELLLATTLSAQVAAAPRMRAYTIAMNPVQAGLFSGASGVRQFWFNSQGQFETLGEAPPWFTEFNKQEPVENKRDAKWTAAGARASVPPLRTLAYDSSHPEEFARLYKASPLAQEAQFSLAARLIEKEKLGAADSTDFLCLIAGSTALLGYEVGANSPLMREMTLALDRHIQFLLGKLDAAVGEGGYNLVLAGAHGAPPLGGAAVNGETVAVAVDKALQSAGAGRVAKYVYPFLYLDTSGIRDPEPVRQIAARAALDHPAVAGFYTAGGYCSVNDGWQLRYRNSFHAKRSGDVMLSYRPEFVEDFGQGRGISYGSLYNYDTVVPLAFCGPSFRPGTYEHPVESVDIAPTLARLLGVSEPSSSIGRVLGEAFNE